MASTTTVAAPHHRVPPAAAEPGDGVHRQCIDSLEPIGVPPTRRCRLFLARDCPRWRSTVRGLRKMGSVTGCDEGEGRRAAAPPLRRASFILAERDGLCGALTAGGGEGGGCGGAQPPRAWSCVECTLQNEHVAQACAAAARRRRTRRATSSSSLRSSTSRPACIRRTP